MSKAVLVLLAATLGLGVVSLHLVRELRAEREQVQSLQTRVSELQSAPRPGATFSVVPQASSSPFQPDVSRPRATPTSPAAANTSRTVLRPLLPQVATEENMRSLRESMDRQRALLQDPEYRDALRSQNKAMLLQTYPELAKELDMNAEELDQLLNLLADQQLRSQETIEPMAWNDSAPDSAAMEEMQRKALAEHQTHEAELAAQLGSKLQAWKEYQSTLGVRHQVMHLRGVFASRGAPLQESQSKPLLNALAQVQQRYMKELSESQSAPPGNAMIAIGGSSSVGNSFTSAANSPIDGVRWQEQQLERTMEMNERARDAVSHILTSQQLKIFDENQNAQLKMQQVQLRMMRAQAQAETQ